MKKIYLFIISIMLFLTLTACSKNSVVGIESDIDKINVEVGEKQIIIASVLPSTADNKKIRWESSEPKVATVANGVIRGKSKGVCKVRAISRDGSFEKVCFVTVREKGLYVLNTFDKKSEGYGVWKFDTISAALAAAENNDKIFVGKGEYKEMVPVTKEVEIYGDNANLYGGFIVGHPTLNKPTGKIIISGFNIASNDENYPCVTIGNETQNIIIEDCAFFGNEKNDAITTISSSESQALSKVTVTCCKFKDFKKAINFKQYVAKGNVEYNQFENCEYSLYLHGAQKTRIFQNEMKESGFIYFKNAKLPTSDLLIKENILISGKGQLPIIVAKYGSIEKSERIKLKTNSFFGSKVEIMTNSEKDRLLSKIDVKNDYTGEGDYKNFVLK